MRGRGLPVFGSSGAAAGAGAAAGSALGAGAAFGAGAGLGAGADAAEATGSGAAGAVPVTCRLAVTTLRGSSVIFSAATIMPFLSSKTVAGLPFTVNL